MRGLIGGKAFTVTCTLVSKNGKRTSPLRALIDSGANLFACIDRPLAHKLRKVDGYIFTRTKIPKLPVAGFTGSIGASLCSVLEAGLTIESRSFPTPFFEVGIGNHDIILGRHWLAHYDVLPDCRRERLWWPDQRNTHQWQANERDQKMAEQDKELVRKIQNRQVPILRRPVTSPPQLKDNKKNSLPLEERQETYQARRQELGISQVTPLCTMDPYSEPPTLALISAPAYLLNLRHEPIAAGTLTLHEVDYALSKLHQDPEDSYEDLDLKELLQQLPKEYHDLAGAFSKKEANTLPEHRSHDHKIKLQSTPELRQAPLYKMNERELEATRTYLMDNLQKGFIEPSDSPFSSPVLFVKKSNGDLRFCVDYRNLNQHTIKDRYPLPLIGETLQRLSKAKVFSKLDVRHAFNRIRMEPESEAWATFRTRFGQYKPKVLPFGLNNGPATFQRYINSVLFDILDQYCTAYLDDILIYSESRAEHKRHVREVLRRLQEAGLQADIKKCEFEVERTKFLGFIVTTNGVEVDPQKIETVVSWPEPTTKKGIQSFLGFCNFYRVFIRNFSRIAKPLTLLTTAKEGPQITLDPEAREAFAILKKALTEAPALTYFDSVRETRVETDCSDVAAGGILTQFAPDKKWHPVAFFSTTLQGPEVNYEIHDKELLAIIRALKEWRAELTSVQEPFLILTDHRAIEYFGQKQVLNSRQVRWSELMSEFNFKLAYRPGKDNVVADVLSRKHELTPTQKAQREAERTRALFSYEQTKEVTLAPVDLPVAPEEPAPMDLDIMEQIMDSNRTSPSLQDYRDKVSPESDFSLSPSGLLLFRGRLAVAGDDQVLRTRLLDWIHKTTATCHPGRTKMRRLVNSRYWWPRMTADIDQYVANCHICRRAQHPRDKTPGLLQPLPIPLRTWEDLSMDFHEPGTPDQHGYDSVLVIVDRLSKRHVCLPTTKRATARTAARLFYKYLWRFRGSPRTITSDRGPQFISQFMDELSKLTRTKLKLSTAEHPQTDGQTEIVNQIIDQRLRPFVRHYQDDWSDLLPALDAAGASMPHESTGLSPSMIDYGYDLRLDFDWTEREDKSKTVQEKLSREEAREWAARIDTAVQWARDNMAKAQDVMRTQANKKRRKPDFGPGDLVFIIKKSWRTDRPSDKLDNPLAGPFRITRMVGHSYELELPQSYKVHNVFHADRLRKDPSNPLVGQHNDPEPPIEVDGELEWEVDQILGSRIVRNRLQYQVEWKNWDPDNTWYPAGNFKNAPLRVKSYHDANPSKPGPPVRLEEWIRASATEEQLQDHPDDNTPRGTTTRTTMRRRRAR